MTTELALALLLFFATHSGPALPSMRAWLIARLGRVPYLLVYSVLSVATVWWLISAKMRAPYVELWAPAPWQHAVTLVAMLAASIFLVAALSIPNPLSIGRPGAPDRFDGTNMLAVTRHPLLVSLALWSGSHLLANGDLASLVLFASLTLFCVMFMKIIDSRKAHLLGAATWQRLSCHTSIIPFIAIARRQATLPVDGASGLIVAAGALLFFVILFFHDDAFGVSPLWLWDY